MYVENHELDTELNTVIVKKNTFTFSDQDVFCYFFSAAPVLERERDPIASCRGVFDVRPEKVVQFTSDH